MTQTHPALHSWQQLKRFAMAWHNRRKMATVKRQDGWRFEPLGERNDRGVRSSKWKVRVLLDKLRHTGEVLPARPLDVQALDAA